MYEYVYIIQSYTTLYCCVTVLFIYIYIYIYISILDFSRLALLLTAPTIQRVTGFFLRGKAGGA